MPAPEKSRSADALKSELETLRRDFSVQTAEYRVELGTLKEILGKTHSQAAELLEESGLVLHELQDRWSFDLELAKLLRTEKKIPGTVIQEGLREHARIILSYLFQLKRGLLFSQPGQIPRTRHLRFHLPVTDILLKTAAEMDEKSRE